MANIVGIENMSVEEIREEVAKGGRFVQYIWCVSIIIMSFKNPTDIFFVRSDESAAKKALPYTLLTLFLGWWGFPWGILYSFQCLGVNTSGGYDLTEEFMQSINASLHDEAIAMDYSETVAENADAEQDLKPKDDNRPVNRSGSVVQR
ncbi:hypothetical protein [Bartonella sp. HY038]|uniref:hypothetical protein n=1 Tax=Bartonella sp. HY038 TaxID=2759660 RepID=UPI0015FB7839|nr:hypothetical protein [Bartonella sp. HY038]